MSDQIELITAAITHKQNALDALKRLSLQETKTQLKIALDIDPYLADVKTLLQTVEYLLKLRVRPNTQAPGLAKAWCQMQASRDALPSAVYRILETRLYERILELLPVDDSDFVDVQEQTLHIGYGCLVLDRFEEAHDKLLDYLTTHEEKPTSQKPVEHRNRLYSRKSVSKSSAVSV